MTTKITINDVEKVARRLAEEALNINMQYVNISEPHIKNILIQELGLDYAQIQTVYNALRLAGYIRAVPKTTKDQLTGKAMELLNTLPHGKKIFVSYKRSQSSLLALFFHTRLMLAGAQPFLDVRSIEPGSFWHAQLKDSVRISNYFIVLLAPETLFSKPIASEISWAVQYNIPVVPIRHRGFDFVEYDSEWAITRSDYNYLIRSNVTPKIIDDEDMDSIRSQTEYLLNSLGYSVL